MSGTQFNGFPRPGEVAELKVCRTVVLKLVFQECDFFSGGNFELIYLLSKIPLFLFGDILQGFEEVIEQALLSEIFDAEGFNALKVF